jgi:myo-inositol-1(or 4)-monophosphatase
MILSLKKKELNAIRQQAERIAVAAGIKIHHTVKKIAVLVHKERQDVATKMDMETERFIKRELHTLYPEHLFFAEESATSINSDIPTWVIDPIDGTKEFIRDMPIFCTTFCLSYKNEILVSVIYNPRTNELFSAAKGCGAYKNGKKVKISMQTDIRECTLFFRLPDYKVDELKMDQVLIVFKRLAKVAYRVRGALNQNLALCWVGMGGYDGYINLIRSDNPWDYAPGSLFFEEAGGKLHLLGGRKFGGNQLARHYIAANHELVEKLLPLIGK